MTQKLTSLTKAADEPVAADVASVASLQTQTKKQSLTNPTFAEEEAEDEVLYHFRNTATSAFIPDQAQGQP